MKSENAAAHTESQRHHTLMRMQKCSSMQPEQFTVSIIGLFGVK